MNQLVLGPLDIAVIVASLAIVMGVGLYVAGRESKTAHGYFLASGRLPWWVIGSAMVATSVSSEQIVGTIGAGYLHGMGITNWEWWTLPTYSIVILFFIPVYLKSRVVTVPHYLSKRFGPLCGDIYSWVMLVAYVVVFLVPVLYGGSLAFSDLTGWNSTAVLWGMTLLVALYTVKGGLASVVWTDVVQCAMLVGCGILLFFVALDRTPGGWDAIVAANPQRFHLYHPPDDPIAPFLGLIFLSLGLGPFYQGTNQVMVQRVLAARSTWDGIMGTIAAGFINVLRPLVTVFPGFVAYHWIHELNYAPPLQNPDTTFPFVLKTVGSAWGLRGLILAGFLAAVMSSVSALANSTATIFALDVYQKLFRPDAEDRQIVRVGRIASFLSLLLAAMLAPLVEHMGGIFQFFQTGVTYVATPFISVILLGLLWKRTNYPGALFGIIGGLLIEGLVVGASIITGANLHWLYCGFIAQVFTMAGVILVTLWTPAAPPPGALLLTWDRGLLSQFGGRARPWYQSLRLWFGIYACIWFYLYWRYW